MTATREEALLRQQDVLARFGELAVRSDDLDKILHEACRLIGEAFGTDLAKVVERGEGDTLLVRAGVGWPPGIVGRARLKATPDTSEGYALERRQPVISPDIDSETRFKYPDFIREAGIKALANVPILLQAGEDSFGMLEIDSRTPREFDEHDTTFLRSYANLLSAAIERLRAADKLARGSAQLREAFERQSAALETGLIGFFECNVRERKIAGDRRFADFHGLDPVQAEAGVPLMDVFTWIDPDDRPAVQANVEAALASRSDFSKEFRIRHAEGRTRWVLVRARCSQCDGDGPLRYTGTVVDITASKTTEAALRESEARFQQFGAASSDALWIRNAETLRFEYVSPAFETIYGVTRAEIVGDDDLRAWAELIVPADRERALQDIEQVRRGNAVTHEFRIERASDGETRWVRDTLFPLFDKSGGVQRVGGIARDVTEERATAARMQILVAELQHRTRNLVAVIRALSARTLASSSALSDFRERFEARLAALSRVNGLLSRLGDTDRITFDELIRAELSAHGVLEDGVGTQVVLDGPTGVRLKSGTVQTLALALHELATNALKYGALSSPTGRLLVRWRSERGPARQYRLRVDWVESGVPIAPNAELARPGGYGRELIEKALPFQLRAKTSYEIGPAGVRCSIDLPVSSWHEAEHAPRPLDEAARSSPAGG